MGRCLGLDFEIIWIFAFFVLFWGSKVQFSLFWVIFYQNLTFGPPKKEEKWKNQNYGQIQPSKTTHSLCIWISSYSSALEPNFYSFLVISSWKMVIFYYIGNSLYISDTPQLWGTITSRDLIFRSWSIPFWKEER